MILIKSSINRMARRQSIARISDHTAKDKAKESTAQGSTSEDLLTAAESLKTAKEKECWKLFQKMTNRGISVSYDTILRGMLTPTELRIIQKQKEQEEAAALNQQTSQFGKTDLTKS